MGNSVDDVAFDDGDASDMESFALSTEQPPLGSFHSKDCMLKKSIINSLQVCSCMSAAHENRE